MPSVLMADDGRSNQNSKERQVSRPGELHDMEWERMDAPQAAPGQSGPCPALDRSQQGPFAAGRDVALESTGTCPEDGLSAGSPIVPGSHLQLE